MNISASLHQISGPRFLYPQTNLLFELEGFFGGPHVVLVKSLMEEGRFGVETWKMPEGDEVHFRFVSHRKSRGTTLKLKCN